VGVDLEADSLFSLSGKGLSGSDRNPSREFFGDPLQIGGLSPLKPFFANPDIRKVFMGRIMTFAAFIKIFPLR